MYSTATTTICNMIGLEPNDRCNIRIVRGQGSDLYQINSENGVLRLDTGDANRASGPDPLTDVNEPRYNQPAEVYVGIQGTDRRPHMAGRFSMPPLTLTQTSCTLCL